LAEESALVQTVLTTIWLRDAHRVFRIHHLIRLCACVTVLILLNFGESWALLHRSTVFKYIFTDTKGQVVQMIPLDQAKQTDEFVKRWTVNSVVEAYTFDYKNYRRQLSWAQDDMTVVGWQEWQKALEASGNFRAVLVNGYVATAVPNGPIEIIKRGDFNGRFAWRVRFPLLVVYQSSLQRTNQDLVIEAVVIRQPEFVNISGLGLRQIVATGGGL
jgi:intracellular multiplication protein IcmL